jgi:hypothetical protein
MGAVALSDLDLWYDRLGLDIGRVVMEHWAAALKAGLPEAEVNEAVLDALETSKDIFCRCVAEED